MTCRQYSKRLSLSPADAGRYQATGGLRYSNTGGHGAVRECIEMVLTNKGYEQALLAYLDQSVSLALLLLLALGACSNDQLTVSTRL